MKVIVAGSRSIQDYNAVRKAIILSGLWQRYGKNIEVVCGMARGVDMLGFQFAQNNNLVLHEWPADWEQYGKRAGYIRNCLMAENAQILVMVWDGKSNGSRHMLNTAKAKGLEIHAFIYDGDNVTYYDHTKG